MKSPLAAIIVAEAIVPRIEDVERARDRRTRRRSSHLAAWRVPWRRSDRVRADRVRRAAVS
jgi:hypothetical protein